MSDRDQLGKITAVVTAVGMILGIWIQYRTNELDTIKGHLSMVIDQQKLIIAKQAEGRSERESREKYWQWIHEKLVESLEKRSATEQRIVYHYIGTLEQHPEREAKLKSALLEMLEEQATDDTLVELAASDKQNLDTYISEESDKSTPPDLNRTSTAVDRPLGNTNIDVFWCEANGDEYRRLAEALQARIQSEMSRGRVRTRMLPAIVNSSAGYSVQQPTITADYANDDEHRYATRLQPLVAQAIPGLTQEQVRIKMTSQGTPLYMGVFLCSTG